MKIGVLFSGGKDSCYAAWLAKKSGYKISCLISVISKNKESYMFHTPSIERVKEQSKVMKIPLISVVSKGKKESELKDLRKAIKIAVKDYEIKGIITGAVESVYQASRIQKICNELDIECFNPLWQKDQFKILEDLIKNKFEVVISGVFAHPLDDKWLGREIDKKFVNEMKKLNEKWEINPAGEGGEFESFVINCPLFKRKLKIISYEDEGEKNSWIRELVVK